MALSITVTKKQVTQSQEGLWNISLNLTCLNGVTEVINQDFLVRYKVVHDLETKVKEVQTQMQQVINYYKSSNVVFNHTKLANAVTYLNTNLVG